jgi:hypothetical protein
MRLLSLKNIKNDISINNHGVYIIFLYQSLKPKLIFRFLENDETGLIYIGAAEKTSLAYILNCFLASKNLNEKQNNHSGGDKIS